MTIDVAATKIVVQRTLEKLSDIEKTQRKKVFPPDGALSRPAIEPFMVDVTYLQAIRASLISEAMTANEAAAAEEPAPEDLTPGNEALALGFDIMAIGYRVEEAIKKGHIYLNLPPL